jgi:hypothetical protein
MEQRFPPRLLVAQVVTFLAFLVSLVASLNLYLIEEDDNKLTEAAYNASLALRLSYDAIYLSALVAGVTVCAIGIYAFVQQDRLALGVLGVLTLLVALGGFGGLLVRYPITFLAIFAAFLALTLLCFLVGRAVMRRAMAVLERRAATVLGACASAGCVLLINVVALVLHTLLLNPVSHELYMLGQIAGTPWNLTLIMMVLAFLMLVACLASLGRALTSGLRQNPITHA